MKAVASLLLRRQSVSIHFVVKVDDVQKCDDAVRVVVNLVSSSTSVQPEGREQDGDSDDDSDGGGSRSRTQHDKTPSPGLSGELVTGVKRTPSLMTSVATLNRTVVVPVTLAVTLAVTAPVAAAVVQRQPRSTWDHRLPELGFVFWGPDSSTAYLQG